MTGNNNTGFEFIEVEQRSGVDWLTLNRPQKLNAISPSMAAELVDYFGALATRRDVRVVVLRGAGRHFCAGFDLDHVSEVSASMPRALRHQRLMSEIIVRMRRCPQPVIALIHGAACGAGIALALAADVRYAAEGAKMNVAMAKVGLTGCDMGISYFLPRTVGASNAAEMMMGGRFVHAERALRIGLVSDVVPVDQLAACGEALAREMTAMSPTGLRLTKEGMNAASEIGSLETVIAMEDRGQVLCTGPLMQEGVAAFRQKRAPHYSDE